MYQAAPFGKLHKNPQFLPYPFLLPAPKTIFSPIIPHLLSQTMTQQNFFSKKISFSSPLCPPRAKPHLSSRANLTYQWGGEARGCLLTATSVHSQDYVCCPVSIHAPVKGRQGKINQGELEFTNSMYPLYNSRNSISD